MSDPQDSDDDIIDQHGTIDNVLVSDDNSNYGADVRNLIGFWILGLCNNFAYVIMLSAADDILELDTHNHTMNIKPFNSTISGFTGPKVPICHKIGTGAILLADIIPGFAVKLFASFTIQSVSYKIRILAVIVFSAVSYPIVSFAPFVTISIIGVAFASLGGGLGEFSFMGLLSHFNKNCVSTWSSGTGAAGLLGSLSYATMTTFGHMTPRSTLLVMLVVPVVMFFCYFYLLVKPAEISDHIKLDRSTCEEEPLIPTVDDEGRGLYNDPDDLYAVSDDPDDESRCQGRGGTNLVTDRCQEEFKPTLIMKMKHIRYLMKYMLPLTLVYFSEYLINQSLFELIYFRVSWMSIAAQYRWYQVLYQFGVFVSRSSVNIFRIKYLWLMSFLQCVNFIVLIIHILYPFLGNLWIVFAIIFYEGLLGGATYVNTFYMIRNEEEEKWKEFSMGAVCIADAAGIVMSGLVSVPLHNYLCTL